MEVNKHLRGHNRYQAATGASLTTEERLHFHKLDWNESPIAPSPHVLQWLHNVLIKHRTFVLNDYPDIEAQELCKHLQDYTGIPASGIRAFNGSDDALRTICETFLSVGDRVGVEGITYTQPHTFIRMMGANAVRRMPFDMVYIVNPNNPTGQLYSPSLIKGICSAAPATLFVVDEAYYEFSGVTVADLVEVYNNLIITRTFSKAFGLAGMRVGYTLSSADLACQLDLVRNGKNVNTLAQVAAVAALEDLDYMRAHVEEVTVLRDWICRELAELGFDVVNPLANFLTIRTKEAYELQEHLYKYGILVRVPPPSLGYMLRVTIGTRISMKAFLAAIKEYKESS